MTGKRRFLPLLALGALALLVAGCDSNPTNEPSPAAIEDAKAKRAAAIDADPKMSPEGKAKMKEMLKLGPAQAAEGRGK